MLTERAEEWKRQLRREGQLTIVLDLLEYRFGVIPVWARERLAVAKSEDLQAWSLRLLDAKSLDEVFR